MLILYWGLLLLQWVKVCRLSQVNARRYCAMLYGWYLIKRQILQPDKGYVYNTLLDRFIIFIVNRNNTELNNLSDRQHVIFQMYIRIICFLFPEVGPIYEELSSKTSYRPYYMFLI